MVERHLLAALTAVRTTIPVPINEALPITLRNGSRSLPAPSPRPANNSAGWIFLPPFPGISRPMFLGSPDIFRSIYVRGPIVVDALPTAELRIRATVNTNHAAALQALALELRWRLTAFALTLVPVVLQPLAFKASFCITCPIGYVAPTVNATAIVNVTPIALVVEDHPVVQTATVTDLLPRAVKDRGTIKTCTLGHAETPIQFRPRTRAVGAVAGALQCSNYTR